MLWDMNYFKYYFLKLARIPFGENELENEFSRFADYLLGAGSDYFMYRDLQSRNIMVVGGEPWFIDYQGGRKGPLHYDIASLAYDAKADIPFDVRDELLALYLEASGVPDRERFLSYYPGFVFMRIMQALGAYGLRGFYERKPHFLMSIPYAAKNLEHLLRTTKITTEFPALAGAFGRIVDSEYLRRFVPPKPGLMVRIDSFSYHAGIPPDAGEHGGGFVFDCRALPNPGRQARFAALTGKDPEVAEFLGKEPVVREFLAHVLALVERSVENYRERGFTNLSVAFGCTGGRHRSVYCAEWLAGRIFGARVELHHRALEETSPR